jgi:cAMP-dependent protein kinase regulator
MYFIEEGTVSIKIQQDGGETEISKLEKGQYFGELALVTHRPRAASAYAQNTVKVACKFCRLFLYRKILMTVCFV